MLSPGRFERSDRNTRTKNYAIAVFYALVLSFRPPPLDGDGKLEMALPEIFLLKP